ncbi:MAG: OmpA family protein [Alphaproteobacteria bacterium]|nr:OmpA family protein [Alphaproteobacteria bacterium]
MRKHNVSVFVISRMLALTAVLAVAACANSNDGSDYPMMVSTPTVDYVEQLDVYSAPHKDSFLNQLAMNYRSYAIYNARTSGYPDVGELFANKAVAAFSGEVPYPESLDNWPVDDERVAYDLTMAYNDMVQLLQNDASQTKPELAAELQAKYDCWLSAVSTGQSKTARECQSRFEKTLVTLRDCVGGKIVSPKMETNATISTGEVKVTNTNRSVGNYYPETSGMAAMRGANRTRDGVIIVNNVNVPEHLINPEPVQRQPLVFNQNIYGGDKTINDNSGSNSHNVSNSANTTSNCPCRAEQPAPAGNVILQMPPMPDVCECEEEDEVEEVTVVGDALVTREEFINMMMAMRAELASINARLDKLSANQKCDDCEDETTVIKVQQIPVEPKQHVMEEVFEIRFDFNKAIIKPEYEDLIKKLVGATQANRNIKVSVVGHTDTSGSKSYNYALGGRRAEAVQKMLIEYGIPSSQIVAVSAGEEDLKVPTPDGVPNAENRRVRVVKEVTYTEPGGTRMMPIADVSVQEYVDGCDGSDCDM